MKHPFRLTGILWAGIFIFLTTQGCMGSKKTVELLPVDEPLTCGEMLSMEPSDIPDHDFNHALNTTFTGPAFQTCWKPLMKQALGSGRKIPKYQLARAIHIFNRNDSKHLFSAAVFLYFREILDDNGMYGERERKLMVAYLSFAIQNANSKKDQNLETARLICSRLDPELYNKYFL